MFYARFVHFLRVVGYLFTAVNNWFVQTPHAYLFYTSIQLANLNLNSRPCD